MTSGDPAHTPIWKLEPFKQAYKREAGPFAWFYRALNLKPAVTAAELREWQELLYDTCTMCGRCSMVCPMGIDIASLVGLARHAMYEAGMVPHELWAVAERAKREGSPLGATPKVLKERVEWLADEHEVEIPLDKPRAEALVTLSSVEIMKYPASMVALAKILSHAGVDRTLRSDGSEATNFGLFSGNLEWQKDVSLRVIRAAIACGAKTLVLPECGHAYGATQAPREVLRALGVELREMPQGGDANWCCGGGGGVVTLHRADEHRRRAFIIKMNQVEATGAEKLVSSCANCRLTFDDNQAHYKWDRKIESLLELVAASLY